MPVFGSIPLVHVTFDTAFETVKHSIVTMRGCFGGCTFCSITEHEGRIIQSRSAPNVLREVRALSRMVRTDVLIPPKGDARSAMEALLGVAAAEPGLDRTAPPPKVDFLKVDAGGTLLRLSATCTSLSFDSQMKMRSSIFTTVSAIGTLKYRPGFSTMVWISPTLVFLIPGRFYLVAIVVMTFLWSMVRQYANQSPHDANWNSAVIGEHSER